MGGFYILHVVRPLSHVGHPLNGLMRLRIASINDLPINEGERRYHWPLGRRPDDHPSLSDLGF